MRFSSGRGTPPALPLEASAGLVFRPPIRHQSRVHVGVSDSLRHNAFLRACAPPLPHEACADKMWARAVPSEAPKKQTHAKAQVGVMPGKRRRS